MSGGVAVAANLLCVAWTGARGRVFLFDLDERRPMSFWDLTEPGQAWSDAGGVAVDCDFTIYVADAVGNRVRRYTAFGKELASFGRSVERGVGAASRDRRGVLDHPRAVAVFDGAVYVACGERKLRNGVQCLDRNGGLRTDYPSFGDPQERFGAPQGVWAGREGLFVADTLHGVVQRFRLHGATVGHFSTAAAPDERSRPVAVVVTGERQVLVVDHGDRPGLKLFQLGGEAVPLPAALTVGVEDPVALARDGRDRIYILDQHGERVQRTTADLRELEPVVQLREILDDSGADPS